MYFKKTCLPSIDRLTQRSCSQRVKKSDKTWSVSYGLAHLDRTILHRIAPYRTVPNRTYTHVHGSLMVRSWFALGSFVVLLRYSTVTVRYFNFFLTGTVHVHVRNTFNFQNTNLKIQKRKYYVATQEQCVYMYMYVYIEVLYVHCTYSRH